MGRQACFSRKLEAGMIYREAGPDARMRFLTRVAANALKIAEREALLAAVHEQRHQARLAALGCADDAALCAAIRDGSLDHRFASARFLRLFPVPSPSFAMGIA